MTNRRQITAVAGTVLLTAAALAALAFGRAQAKIAAAAPVVGSMAPALRLPDQDGKRYVSAQDKGHAVLLAFYPADFTGGCTLEAHSLSGASADLQALGVRVYGISVQDAKSHKSFCTTEGIPYTLLADTARQAARDYGVLIPGVGIASRVTYLVGANGKIAYIDKNVNAHLASCGPDWVAWVKAHPEVTAP